jgi:hypothetical protein
MTVSGTAAVEAVASSTSDIERAQLVRDLFQRAREARRPLVGRWKRSYRTLNNRDWQAAASNDQFQPAANVPHIWPVVASLVAWMTDQRPTIEVSSSAVPMGPLDDLYMGAAQDMNAVMAAIVAEYRLDAEINKVLWDVMTYGVGYFTTVWEPWLADGLGDSVFRRVDPFTVYPDPWARSPRDLNFIIQARAMTLDDLDRAFPGAGAAASDGWIEDTDEAPHRLEGGVNMAGPRANLAPLSPATTARYARSDRKPTIDSPIVTVLECWIRSHKHTKTAKGTKTVESWRVLMVCGNRVLMDEDGFDVSGHGQQPIDRMVMFDTGEWYGPSLVDNLGPLQNAINRELANLAWNIALMGNPILLEGQNVQSKRISNRPGQRISVRRPDDVAWLSPPQIHPQMAVELISYYESKIESVSGMSAIVRGFSPSGRNAQGTLDQVQDAAFVRVRATLRELERALCGVGSKMVANIAELYTEPRVISVVGPDGQRTTELLRSRHFYRSMNDDGTMAPLRFNLQADAGSQLPTSRQARGAEAANLFALGAIDVLELLKAKQWPSWSVVAKRVMEQQAMAGGSIGPGARQRTRA